MHKIHQMFINKDITLGWAKTRMEEIVQRRALVTSEQAFKDKAAGQDVHVKAVLVSMKKTSK